MTTRSLRTQYSSANIAPKDRHEAFVNRNWPSPGSVCSTVPVEAFSVSSTLTLFGDLALSDATISGQRWSRSRTELRKYEADALLINISHDIEAVGVAGEREFRQRRRHAVLVDLRQQFAHQATGGRSQHLTIPRNLVAAAGLEVSELHGLMLSQSASAMLSAFVRHLQDSWPWPAHIDAQRSLIDLLVLAVGTTRRGPAQAAAAAAGETLALRAKLLIDADPGSPLLSVAALAQTLAVSRSTLHRAFRDAGGIAAYIRGARLDLARRLLGEPECLERIGDLAERLGFADSAHLSRNFRHRFGMTPSDWRAIEARRQLEQPGLRRRPATPAIIT